MTTENTSAAPAKAATKRVETKTGLRDIAYACFVVASFGIIWLLAGFPVGEIYCQYLYTGYSGGCQDTTFYLYVFLFAVPGLFGWALFGLAGVTLTAIVFAAVRDWRLLLLSALEAMGVVYFLSSYLIPLKGDWGTWVLAGVLVAFAMTSLVIGTWWFLVGRKHAVLVTSKIEQEVQRRRAKRFRRYFAYAIFLAVDLLLFAVAAIKLLSR
jgi:hypothetical protein